jgi:hypothetical protein
VRDDHHATSISHAAPCAKGQSASSGSTFASPTVGSVASLDVWYDNALPVGDYRITPGCRLA